MRLPLTVDTVGGIIATTELKGDSRQVAGHGADGGSRGLDHYVAREIDTERERISRHQRRDARALPAPGPKEKHTAPESVRMSAGCWRGFGGPRPLRNRMSRHGARIAAR